MRCMLRDATGDAGDETRAAVTRRDAAATAAVAAAAARVIDRSD